MAANGEKQKFLLYGKNGWIGGMLIELIKAAGDEVVLGNARLENREAVAAEIDAVKPTRVLNAAGVTGRPNVDWCEFNKQTVIRTNIIGCLNLADLCWQRQLHCTLYATGCIFEYDDAHPLGGGVSTAFTEEDRANFTGSYYSLTKGFCEEMLRAYLDHLTVLRVRMPISDDLSPRNFITKISKYEKVVNIPNSMTVLHDLLPASLALSKRKLSGIYNFCNPGAISHNECLELYKKHVDPDYTYVQRRPRIATKFENKTTLISLSWRRSQGDASRSMKTAASRETAAGGRTSRWKNRTRSSRPSARTTSWIVRSWSTRCPTWRSRRSTSRWTAAARA